MSNHPDNPVPDEGELGPYSAEQFPQAGDIAHVLLDSLHRGRPIDDQQALEVARVYAELAKAEATAALARALSESGKKISSP